MNITRTVTSKTQLTLTGIEIIAMLLETSRITKDEAAHANVTFKEMQIDMVLPLKVTWEFVEKQDDVRSIG